MKDYKHIEKMENILNTYIDKIDELYKLLDYFDKNGKDYKNLIDYYYSEKREQDLQDDEKGLLPKDLKRGVLSEDGIYNMLIDHKDVSVKMLEVATKMIKNDI